MDSWKHVTIQIQVISQRKISKLKKLVSQIGIIHEKSYYAAQ